MKRAKLRAGLVAGALTMVAVVGGADHASAETVVADDGVSTMSASCAIATNRAKTYYSVGCDSFWPWDDFIYRARIRCTDNLTHYGLAVAASDHTFSRAECPPGTYYTEAHVDTWD